MSSFMSPLELTVTNWKILIQGQVSGGKSWLAGTAGTTEKKVRFFDFDNKAAALMKHPNVANILVKSYVDITGRQGSVPEPRAAVEFINDIGTLEYEKKSGKYIPCINVIDSLTYLAQAIDRMWMYGNPASRKELAIGALRLQVPDQYGPYRDTDVTLNSILGRLFALDDLIVIAHERPEEDKTSSDKDKMKRLTGRYSLHPPRLDILKSLFNDKFRVLPRETAGGDFKVQLETNDDYLGATSMLGVKACEVANLAMLFQKHDEAKRKLKETLLLETKNEETK